ncbi:hypothetical protein FDP41_006683 [Naegleria fowleri]|uniref:Uncharacterized protein n=1 Tax=Naegleria fowleri TaxID=5763 RepID=A0A6A5B662_NAEFO|nr:uncharacterized protein FDP41_006683 [Naegleria fowleri]KAF0974073.1 hypothetical protein FDP41_006683 [Naegleria fowleri]
MLKNPKKQNNPIASTHDNSNSLISVLSSIGVKVNLKPITFSNNSQKAKEKQSLNSAEQIKEHLRIASNDHPVSISKNAHDELFRIKFSTASIGHYHCPSNFLTMGEYQQIEQLLEKKKEPIDVITIEIEFLKPSYQDLLKYFSISKSESPEEQILRQLVDTIDADEIRKHVYIRIWVPTGLES